MTKLVTPPTSGAIAIVTPRSALLAKLDELSDLEPIVARRLSYRTQRALKTMFPLAGSGEETYRRALTRAERLPDRLALHEQREALWDAVYVAASEPEIEALVGAMIDGVPNAASRVTPTVIDAIVYSIIHADDGRDPDDYPCWRGYSANVLACATRRIWSTQKFAFGAAEVLEAASAVRLDYWRALRATIQIEDLRVNAETIVNDFEDERELAAIMRGERDEIDDFGGEP